jgi:hypothetical protein
MTDWDKELAKIDKQLKSISDEELAKPSPPVAPAGGGAAKPGKAIAPSVSAVKGSAAAPSAATGTRAATWGVVARLTLSVALGVGMLFWPYEARCGAGLAAYLGAVTAVAGSGIWSAVWSWRHRAGRAHSLSLLLLFWGLVLGSLEVLPRIGYAKPDARHPATWTCQ